MIFLKKLAAVSLLCCCAGCSFFTEQNRLNQEARRKQQEEQQRRKFQSDFQKIKAMDNDPESSVQTRWKAVDEPPSNGSEQKTPDHCPWL